MSSLLLKRISQEVDLSRPGLVQYFLVFGTPSGKEVRLPVLKETSDTLVAFLYGSSNAPEQSKEANVIHNEEYEIREEESYDPPAESYLVGFEGDEQEDEEESQVEDNLPESEDEVPEL